MPQSLKELDFSVIEKKPALGELDFSALEQPDFGMAAIPKKELPGVWEYDKQLDDLFSGETELEDMLPLDVRYDFGRIIGMTERPDEARAKMVNSLYYTVQLGIPPETAFNMTNELNKIWFGEKKLPLQPGKLFAQSFIQSMADKPAMMLKGLEVYTPGTGKVDMLLEKSATFLQSLKDPKTAEKLQQARAGKLWPVSKYAKWHQVQAKYLPEVINAWATNIGDQIPIMLITWAGRLMGKAVGEPVGTATAAAWATATGGLDPTDVATAPLVKTITSEIIKHLGGAAPLVAMEAGFFMDEAETLKIDKDISEKYAKMYGLGSGAIEYAQWLWVLGRYKAITKPAQKTIMRQVLTHIGGSAVEGMEEISQEGLQNWLLQKAVADMKERHLEYEGVAPKTWEGWKRSGAIGAGVSFITAMPGTGLTMAQGRTARRNIVKPETKMPEVVEVKAPPTEAEKAPSEAAEAITTKIDRLQAEIDIFVEKGQKPPAELISEINAAKKELRQKPLEITGIRAKVLGKAEIAPTAKPEADVRDEMKDFFAGLYRDKYQITPPKITKGKDGIWIRTPDAPTKGGIFIEAEDWQKNKQFYETYLEDADERVIKAAKPEAVGVAPEVKAEPAIVEKKTLAEIKKETPEERKYFTDLLLDERERIFNEAKGYIDQFGPDVLVQDFQPRINEIDKDLRRRGYNPAILPKLGPELKKAIAEGWVPVKAKEKLKAEPVKVEKPKESTKPGVSLLGGVPVEAPGLTRDEIQHLGKREQEALRAAQRRGLKVGYKQGAAETIADARRSLDAFRIKEAISQKGKMDVASVVLTYVPKEKQGDYIRRILQAKTQKRIERLTEAIDKYLDKYEKRQAVRGFKDFVKGIKKKYRRGEVALGQLPSKLRESLIEVLDKFDLAKISEKKEETFESRLKFVTRISGELANGFEGLNTEFDKDATDLLMMGKARIEELRRLGQTYIGDLDVDNIKYIQASLEHLLKINDLKGKSKERRRMENLRTDINNARQEVKPAKEKVTEWTGLLGAFRWIEVEGQSQMRSLVGLVTGKNYDATMKILVHEPNKTNIDRKGKYKDFIMHFRKLADKANLKWKDVKKFNERIKIKLGGKEIETDYASLLSILAHIEAEGNLRQLLKTKGLNITVYARDEHGFITKKNIYRVGTPTLAELRAIMELVPEAHKKLLNVYFKTNWEKQAPAINEMSMKHVNYDLAVKKKYFHINREIERAVEGKKADISVSIDQQSRGLPRTGGTARINIVSFPLEVMETMQWSAAYATMTEAMENARTLVANPKWREAMKQAGNQRALKEITTLLRRAQGLITDQSVLEAMAGKHLRQIGKSILSLRFSGGFVQTASMPAAVEFIGKKYLFNTDFSTPALIKHLKNIDPVLWLRWEGKQFDYALGMVGAQNAFEKLLFDHTPLTDKFLGQYTIGDEIAIGKLFMGAERHIEDTTKLKKVRTEKGNTEFEKATLDLLHEAMTTQPQWDMLHRTPITSDPSMFIRPFTMFRSAIIAQRNVLVRAVDDYFFKGRITLEQFAERFTGVGMSVVLVTVSRHLFKTLVFAGATTALVAMGLREPPDEEEIKEEATKLVKKIGIQSVFTFVGLDIIGSLFASMGYKTLQVRKYGWGMGDYGDIRTGNIIADVTLDIMQTGVDFALFTEQLISGEKYKSGKNRGRYKWEITGLRLIDEIAALFAYRYGLPYEGPKSDIIWPVKKALPEKPKTLARRKEVRYEP